MRHGPRPRARLKSQVNLGGTDVANPLAMSIRLRWLAAACALAGGCADPLPGSEPDTASRSTDERLELTHEIDLLGIEAEDEVVAQLETETLQPHDDRPITLFIDAGEDFVAFSVTNPEGETLAESEPYVAVPADDEHEARFLSRIELSQELLLSPLLKIRVPEAGSLPAVLRLCDEIVTDPRDAGPGTLRDAMANVRPRGSVCFDAAVFGVAGAPTVELRSQISTDRQMSVVGLVSRRPVVTTHREDRILELDRSTRLRHLVLRDGAADNGGLVRFEGGLELFDVLLEGGTATDAGGAIYGYVDSDDEDDEPEPTGWLEDEEPPGLPGIGRLYLKDTVVRWSSATLGGGIFVHGDAVRLDHGDIFGNAALGAGGGIFATCGTTEIFGTRIHHNTASSGGGLYSRRAVELGGGTVVDFNEAEDGAGVLLRVWNATSTINGASIVRNVATGDGGGLNVGGYGSTVNIVAGAPGLDAVAYNSALSGGGIFASYASIYVRGVAVVRDNSATFGGGAYVYGPFASVVAVLDDAKIIGNEATYDGGGLNGNSLLYVGDRARVEGNVAGHHGGGIYNADTTIVSGDDARVIDNTAVQGGGVWSICGGFSADPGAYPLVYNNPDNLFEDCP